MLISRNIGQTRKKRHVLGVCFATKSAKKTPIPISQPSIGFVPITRGFFLPCVFCKNFVFPKPNAKAGNFRKFITVRLPKIQACQAKNGITTAEIM
jgi:hypothetical protein